MNSLGLLHTQIRTELLQDLPKNFYLKISNIAKLPSLYREDLSAPKRHFYLFLIQVLGGTQTYSEEKRYPRLRMSHINWKIDPRIRSLWKNAIVQDLDKVTLDQEIREQPMQYFSHAANEMINHEKVE